MTPDEARWLLNGTTPGPWLSDLDRNSDEPSGIYAVAAQGGGFSARLVAEDICEEADTALIAAAPVMAHMIAGMHEEWGVEERHEYTDKWTWHSTYPDRESACSAVNGMSHFRVVRRYVTEPEEA